MKPPKGRSKPLTREAERILSAGFRENKPLEEIQESLRQATGESPFLWVLEGKHKNWKRQQMNRWAAKQQAEDLIADMKSENWGPAELIVALITDALMMEPEALRKGEGLRVAAQSLAAERVRINRERLELEKKRMELKERDKQPAEAPDAEVKAGQLKEVYGLG
jgi:hypothetical protein